MTRALRPAKALLTHLNMLAHRERLPEQLTALATLDINRLLAGAHGRLSPPDCSVHSCRAA